MGFAVTPDKWQPDVQPLLPLSVGDPVLVLVHSSRVNRRSRVRRIMAKKTCFLVRLPHPCENPKEDILLSTHIIDCPQHISGISRTACISLIGLRGPESGHQAPIAIFCAQVGKVRPGSFELNAQFQFS